MYCEPSIASNLYALVDNTVYIPPTLLHTSQLTSNKKLGMSFLFSIFYLILFFTNLILNR